MVSPFSDLSAIETEIVRLRALAAAPETSIGQLAAIYDRCGELASGVALHLFHNATSQAFKRNSGGPQEAIVDAAKAIALVSNFADLAEVLESRGALISPDASDRAVDPSLYSPTRH